MKTIPPGLWFAMIYVHLIICLVGTKCLGLRLRILCLRQCVQGPVVRTDAFGIYTVLLKKILNLFQVNKENRQAGGLHFSTYCATVRRQGVFRSPAHGNVNFNQDLTEPMYTSISIIWDKVFRYVKLGVIVWDNMFRYVKVKVYCLGQIVQVCKVRCYCMGQSIQVRKVKVYCMGQRVYVCKVRGYFVGQSVYVCKFRCYCMDKVCNI
jgi:hypothetical protein